MKKLKCYSIVTLMVILLGSCGVHKTWVVNHNQNTTQVQLSRNNFNVGETVTGSADVSYILIFGGWKKRQIYQEAYQDMVAKANLTGSKAFINVNSEEHLGGVPPFYFKRTLQVTAQVIEFNN